MATMPSQFEKLDGIINSYEKCLEYSPECPSSVHLNDGAHEYIL
jgi:hypothetical protein